MGHEPDWHMVGPGKRLDLAQDRRRIRTFHHPDLVHRPTTCGEKLADRLSALDLITSELASYLGRATTGRALRDTTAAT